MPSYLIVDPTDADAKWAEAILTAELGYEVTRFKTAEEALQHCRGPAKLPDGVLIDLSQIPAFVEEFRLLADARDPQHFTRMVGWVEESRWKELDVLYFQRQINWQITKPSEEKWHEEATGKSRFPFSRLLKRECDLKHYERPALGPAGDDPHPQDDTFGMPWRVPKA